MTIRITLGTILVCLASCSLTGEAYAENPPELQVLDQYLGEWKGTINDQDGTSTNEMTWILNGQVLQQKYQYSDGAEGLILRGYDKLAGHYFITLFDSRGINLFLTGSWNEPTKTFEYTGNSGDNAVTIKSTFRNPQTADWTITLLSSNGDVTEIRGTIIKEIK